MAPETRTKNLMTLLGWQGGTIHDACEEIGCDVRDFLYGNADFADSGPCHDFRRGYEEAEDIALYLSANRGNLQYWLGAVSAVQNKAIDRAKSCICSDGPFHYPHCPLYDAENNLMFAKLGRAMSKVPNVALRGAEGVSLENIVRGEFPGKV